MISRFLGSWWGIGSIWVFCIGWLELGFSVDTLTLALSVLALTFTQLVLREQNEVTERQERKIDAIVHGSPHVDSSVCD
jgi:hypothetical protein